MRIRRLFAAGLLAVVLAACGGEAADSGATAPTAAAPTTAPTATAPPTPTTIAMEDIDFDELLYEEGDLPAGLTIGQFGAVQLPKGLPEPDNRSSVIFANGSKPGGSVSLVAYDDPAELAKAAPLMGPHFNKEKTVEQDGIGESAMFYDGAASPELSRPAEIRFTRCGVVVNAFLFTDQFDPLMGPDATLNYARRLDKRLKKALCP